LGSRLAPQASVHAPPQDPRFYNLRAWRNLRRAYLAAHPLCARCAREGRVTAAAEVHHIEPIAVRPERRLDWSNLEGLCKTHHSRETAQDVNFRRRRVMGR
jgi:5-methylcytosine-specific restriction protein A